MPRIEACRNCRCKAPREFWLEHDHLCERCAEVNGVGPNLEKIERVEEWPPPPEDEPKAEWVEGDIALYGKLWELYLGKVQMLTHAERMAFIRYMDYVSQPKVQLLTVNERGIE